MAVKLNLADLDFILRQIKISEAHAAGTALTDIWVDAAGNVVAPTDPGARLAIPDPHLPYGVRTVDGTYNNIVPGRETWGAADQTMPRYLSASFGNDADGDTMNLGPGGTVTNTDYSVIGTPGAGNGGHSGNVADADPRIISNLVVDMSVNNPAAVAAWFANDAAVAAWMEANPGKTPVAPGSGAPPIVLANAGFEQDSLADGDPGVFTDALGNYTMTAPSGWTITGGLGGVYDPIDSISDPAGNGGGKVAWITGGAVLSQVAGPGTAGVSYTLDFSVGDRTDQTWSGGTARIRAVSPDNATSVLLAITNLPAPSDGQWAPVSLTTGALPAALDGYSLVIEIAQTGGGQVLVDNVSLSNNSNEVEITNADLASIPNIAPDDGISAPFNAWMTFFGQFFDHGLDLINKGNNGTVFIPLQADDPLITHGPDGIAGTGDEITNPALQFMAVTRSTPVRGPGADGILGNADDTFHEGQNQTTPFVDQNQTYTSHASHQVFLREYHLDANGRPVATGKMLDGQNGGLATWADIKAQARDMLGIELTDGDALNIPLIRTDAYGKFIPDPGTGFAQVIVGLGPDGVPNTADDIVVSGTPAAPVNTFAAGAVRIGHAFLDDIAHAANPFDGQTGLLKTADDDSALGLSDSVSTAGKYDNELLDRHFITGDGRGNENIGLTSVHHIFHSEHNRQVDVQMATILASGDIAVINEWLLTPLAAGDPIPTDPAALDWNGERLFQAARFATEMQYQHLVFEEFARKIHPNIEPFVFNTVTDINPAIFAEFANTVYRFGHSMLTDTMPRIYADGSSDDIGLVTSFLNPVAFDNGGTITADEAAGAVVRGMTVERGNAIDEFVVNSLRNNLVGLPLDLAAINIARGRDTGIPSFNDARAELYAQTQSSWLKPYASWTELAINLKNPATIVNLIAAYGQHDTITSALTLADKRLAAEALVFGGTGAPADRLAFLNSTGAWSAANSGLNDIDLWVGGLAERIMPFGGMLGSTFTAIFEAQLEALQAGDRFYYLSRTQGQNFLNELENNSLAKMILANTDLAQPGADGIRGTDDDVITRHIGADAFARYDYVLEVNEANQAYPDPVGADPILEALGMGLVVRDDPATPGADTNYLRFNGGEHVVLGGTAGNDTLISGDGDDAIWGGDGDDRIESGFGVDQVNGGAGDDVITDMGDEADFLKGEDGDDVMATSNGLDVMMGGRGKDAMFLGQDAGEIFGGEGDDFILGSTGADFLLGNEGDDWMEADGGFDTTAGDNSQLFFNSTIIGHDVMFAGTDEHDFDAESGDDIMVQGESVMRNEGMFGFDWSIFKGNALDGYADLRIKIFTTTEADILRNRFDKVEALSGWRNNDTLIGDDRVANGLAGGVAEAEFFNDGLDQAGIDRIAGLSQIVSVGSNGFFEAGNILLGGGGNDLITGNGGDDIIDGDRWLNVRISIRDTSGNEIGTVDSLKHVFDSSAQNVALGWAGKSLFELLIERTIRPSQMQIQREILDGGLASDTDIAVYNDLQANYTITRLSGGAVQVAHTGFGGLTSVTTINDGTDTLRNIEFLRFADGDLFIGGSPATGAPVISDTTPTEGQALTLDLSSIADANGLGTFAFQWQSSADGTNWVNIPGATGATFTPQDLLLTAPGAQAGLQLRVAVSFTDGTGNAEVVYSAATAPVGQNWSGAPLVNNTFNGTAGADIATGVSPILIGGNDVLNGNDGDDTLSGAGGNDTLNGGNGLDRLVGDAGNDLLNGGNDDDVLLGSAGNDVLNGDDGADRLNGGPGSDTVNGGAGDDVVIWNFTGATSGGRDLIDGGADRDTVEINGNGTAETFRIYTFDAAVAAGMTGLNPNTEIVITRNGTTNASIIAELDNIEELMINTLNVSATGGPVGGAAGADTVIVIGDFTTTSLDFNTITIDGTPGDDVVDISSLVSPHRIVFRGRGGNDLIVGTMRPQDVIEMPAGVDPATATVTTGADGMTTVSGPGGSVRFFAPNGLPGLIAHGAAVADTWDGTTPPNPAGEGETTGGESDGEPAEDPVEAPASGGMTGGSDVRHGTSGRDVIEAGRGRDIVFGGEGHDDIMGGAGADMLFGDGGNDRIFGQGGRDYIDAGAGNDTVFGGGGADVFAASVDDGDDVYHGDELDGSGEGDTLDMSAITASITADLGSGLMGRGSVHSAQTGHDVIWGVENIVTGSGDDVITASGAANRMDGGAGNDTFRFLSAANADGDTILGFQPGDRIDVSAIDANGSGAGDGSFTLVSDAFTGTGQLMVRHETREDGDYTVVEGNVSGSPDADFQLSIKGRHDLTSGDFNL